MALVKITREKIQIMSEYRIKSRTGIRRTDFREVTPTEEEKAAWFKKNGRRHSYPYRAVHIPCGKRMWYSGIGIGSHLRACRGGAQGA